MIDLSNRLALVTGASRGIGRAIALSLARHGATVVVNYLKEEQLANQVINEINDCRSITFEADIRNPKSVDYMITEINYAMGNIDILVNNAGIIQDRTLTNMTLRAWQNVIDTNLTGTFNCTKRILPQMIKQQYGRIINIASIIGQTGAYGQSNYAASKAGVIAFTKSVAQEVAKHNITINAVTPSHIETSMLDGIPQNIKEKILKDIPMNRFGKPQEVADIVTFLASKHASYITGQTININGGLI